MATRFIDHLLTGDHASRPAFGSVPQGTLYACTDHDLIYQSDGSTAWSTWATLGAAASGSITASGYTQTTARLLGRTTASTGAIEEITVGSGLSLAAGALTASGGGGKSYVTNPGLRPPDSPATGDIEFLSYANATDPTTAPAGGPGMAWGNQGSATAAINQGRLVMNSTTTTSLRALLIATPGAGNFTVDTACQALQYQNYHEADLVMLWGTPGTPTNIRAVGRQWSGTPASPSGTFVWTTYNTSWAGTAAVASIDLQSSMDLGHFWLRIEWDGTNLVFKASPSGIIGTYITVTSQALGLGRPDYIGVGVNNNGAGAASIAAFSALRFNWTADFDPTTDN